MGDGEDGSAGVTAIRGADGVRGGEGDDGVPLMALITEARGEEDGAGVGRASLIGEGDPNGEDDDAPFTGTGLLLLLLSPSAISARGRRWGEPCATSCSSSLLVGRVSRC